MIDLSKQPPLIRLQLLLTKTELSADQKRYAEDLLTQITDWAELTTSSVRNFSLPLVRHNLMGLDHAAIPDDVWKVITAKANEIALRNMAVVQAQRRFVETCLKPLGIAGIFFKGVTMATQYYPDIGLRPCRDIDILLPNGTLDDAVHRATAQGYQVIVGGEKIHFMSTKRDIRAALKYGEDVTLVFPSEGVVIDLQERLDKHSGIFDGYDFFGQAQTYSFFGADILTMQPDVLFNYICHHHARHTWSNLHWLSDLDALITSPEFDRQRTLDLADELGQRGTVEAGLELHQLLSSVDTWDSSDRMYRGKEFLSLAVRNLAGELDLEKQIGLKLIGGEFMFPWQARPELIQKANKHWWRTILRPTAAQYARYPLPEPLQFLYYLSRPFELTKNRYQRRLKQEDE